MMMNYLGPNLPTIMKYLLKVRVDPMNVLLEMGEQYGGVTHLGIGRRHVFLISSPTGVRHVLQTHQHNYCGYQRSHAHLRPLLGNGLLTSEGNAWKRHRRLIQPAFHKKQLQILSVSMVETVQKFMTGWDHRPMQENTLDIGAEMTLLTLSIVNTALFSNDIGEQGQIVKNALPRVMRYLILGMFNPFIPPEWLPTYRNHAYKKDLETLHSIVQNLISTQRRQGANNESLLGMMIAASDGGDDSRLSDNELHDEVMTLLLAGHETCANALTWALYLLALNPDIQERLAEEVYKVLLDRPPTYEDIPLLPYTAMVFNEVLRLYPPAWIMARDVIADDLINDFLIPAGSTIFLSPYVSHRLASVWDAPLQFDPTRFSTLRANDIPRFAYFPFGGGKRQCLGKNFALMEAVLVLSLMIQRYKFSVQGIRLENQDNPAPAIPDVDMHPKSPILLKLDSR